MFHTWYINGALLGGAPLAQGTATRFGYVEVLYVTELLGLVLIYLGYRLNTGLGSVLLPADASAG